MEVPSYEFDQLIDKNARKKYSCPICHEVMISALRTGCNHRFCKYCITKWKTYFDDCPVCRKRLDQLAPHQRTDKWIQQLFELATPDLRQDRDMCINYRKLQQIKMELVGSQDFQNISPEQLRVELNIPRSPCEDPQRLSKVASAKSLNTRSRKSIRAGEGAECKERRMYELEPLFFQRQRQYSAQSVTQENFKPQQGLNEVAQLYGTPPAPRPPLDDPIRCLVPLHRGQGSSPDLPIPSPTTTEQDNNNYYPGRFKSASAHTYSLHYPERNPTSCLLSLAEFTCHEEPTKADNEEMTESSPNVVNDNDYASASLDTGGGDVLLNEPQLAEQYNSEVASEHSRSLTMLKAESARSRIQQEIALGSTPIVKRTRQTRTHNPEAKAQRDRNDLQSCREALLNLRLRLVPPSKKVSTYIKDKRIQSDDQLVQKQHEEKNFELHISSKDTHAIPKKYHSDYTVGTGSSEDRK